MKKPSISQVGKCRICGATSLSRFLYLPEMPFTDDFISQSRFGNEFRADIDIFVCEHCLTAQTQHDVYVADYYEDYQYSVGDSSTAGRFMQLLAERLQSAYYPDIKGKKVLEIGSSDGQQLVAFKQTGCNVLGYEPSSFLCEAAEKKGIPTIQGLFINESISLLPEDFREVDVVMLSYTFDHLPDPMAFLAAIRTILNKRDGLVVIEIHNLEKIIERKEYCLFEHEHTIYLTEDTAKKMCEIAGLVIIDFDLIPENDRRANSLIFVATPIGSRFGEGAVQPKTPQEFSRLDFYEGVGSNINQGIRNLENFVDHITSQGKTLAGYGAGGRGVMSLAAMSNANKFKYVVDKKPKRPGLLMPKSGIPVVGVEYLTSDQVDEILVFSFGYMNEIQAEVCRLGYKFKQFHSLLDILAGKY